MLYFKNEVVKKILSGATKVYKAVRHTLGPNNCTSIIYRDDDFIVVDDGYTIANSINLEDKIENIGAKVLVNAASEMEIAIGDGTTSTIIIAYNLLKSILKIKNKGQSVNKIFEDIDLIKEKFFLELDKNVKKADNNNVLERVFYTSTNDSYLTSLIRKSLSIVGVHGMIDVRETSKDYSYVDVEKGYYYEHGFFNESIFEFENMVEVISPYVFIQESITKENVIEFKKTLENDFDKNINKSILVITSSINEECIKEIILNNIEKNNKIFVIMLDRNKEIRNDLIYLTKCKPLKYGTCKRVIIDKRVSKFYFDDDIIHDYTLELEKQLSEENNNYNKQRLLHLISSLNSGSAIIYLGGKSELEVKIKKMKTLDGIKAIDTARKYGVIFGGGKEVLLVSKRMHFKTFGEKVFKEAILAPLRCLLENCNVKPKIIKKIFKGKYDYQSIYFDDEKDCVYDPAKLLTSSIEIAISIVKVLAKIDGVIINESLNREKIDRNMFEI